MIHWVLATTNLQEIVRWKYWSKSLSIYNSFTPLSKSSIPSSKDPWEVYLILGHGKSKASVYPMGKEERMNLTLTVALWWSLPEVPRNHHPFLSAHHIIHRSIPELVYRITVYGPISLHRQSQCTVGMYCTYCIEMKWEVLSRRYKFTSHTYPTFISSFLCIFFRTQYRRKKKNSIQLAKRISSISQSYLIYFLSFFHSEAPVGSESMFNNYDMY
jgi:hypothetical protein